MCRPTTPATALDPIILTPVLPRRSAPSSAPPVRVVTNSALELAQQHINAANRIQKTFTDLEMASATPLPGTVTRPQTPITQGIYPNRGFEIRQAAAEAAGSLTRDIQPNPFSMDSGGPSFGRTNMTDVWDDLNDVDEH